LLRTNPPRLPIPSPPGPGAELTCCASTCGCEPRAAATLPRQSQLTRRLSSRTSPSLKARAPTRSDSCRTMVVCSGDPRPGDPNATGPLAPAAADAAARGVRRPKPLARSALVSWRSATARGSSTTRALKTWVLCDTSASDVWSPARARVPSSTARWYISKVMGRPGASLGPSSQPMTLRACSTDFSCTARCATSARFPAPSRACVPSPRTLGSPPGPGCAVAKRAKTARHRSSISSGAVSLVGSKVTRALRRSANSCAFRRPLLSTSKASKAALAMSGSMSKCCVAKETNCDSSISDALPGSGANEPRKNMALDSWYSADPLSFGPALRPNFSSNLKCATKAHDG